MNDLVYTKKEKKVKEWGNQAWIQLLMAENIVHIFQL